MISNCCGAAFYEPGYPDNDMCTSCKEHADGVCEEHVPFYQQAEPENNVQESYTCEECGDDLPYEEQDWDQEAKDRRLGI
jgi:hypothetical protein